MITTRIGNPPSASGRCSSQSAGSAHLLVGVLPVEGYGIIPGTIVFGLGMAAAGWVSRRPA